MNEERRERDVPGDIRGLIESGRIIEAIKLVRERSGLGLREAKAVIDSARSGRQAPGAVVRSTPPAPPLEPRRLPGEQTLPARAQGLVRQGRKIDAIRALRDAEGLGLKEANDRVTAYIDAHPEIRRLYPERGPKVMLAVIVVVVAALLLWFAARG